MYKSIAIMITVFSLAAAIPAMAERGKKKSPDRQAKAAFKEAVRYFEAQQFEEAN